MGDDEYIRLENIVKTFAGGVVANDEITLSVRKGEIHGLLGENGAGKSTLMKVLYGLYQPDSGDIYLRGEQQDFDSPHDAIEQGIGMVHQHFMLIPRMSVLENVILGRTEERNHSGSALKRWINKYRIDYDREEQYITELMNRYEMDLSPEQIVWELDIGERQRIEILKALYKDADVLILDEPTAVLSPQETDRLFQTLETLVDEGLTIILITHKLGEIMRGTDRVTVLRKGRRVDTVNTRSVTKAKLAEMMVGREVVFDIETKVSQVTENKVLEANGLHVRDNRNVEMVSDVDITINEGELVGVAGVSGNGQTELAESLAGVRSLKEGSIVIDGEDLTNSSTKRYVTAGVSYIPADRHKHGSAPNRSVMENLIMKNYGTFGDGIFLESNEARAYAERLVEEYDIKVPNVDVENNKLSGGNLQKVILARELSNDPKLLITNQPTRGLDVGAIEYVRERLLDQLEKGSGILLISEDLDELLELSDRIVVLYEGEIVHQTQPENADRDSIGRAMTEGKAQGRITVD